MSRQLTSRLIPCIYILSEVWLHISSIWFVLLFIGGSLIQAQILKTLWSVAVTHANRPINVSWVQSCRQGPGHPGEVWGPDSLSIHILELPNHIWLSNSVSAISTPSFQYLKCIKIRTPDVYHPVLLITILQAPRHLCQESGFNIC